ncbi:tetratricopeptide repeat protein [Photobacterium minamisatsumaniensis]|uniref:tetratricopeptide repeat protein n=1 Tax=Photobacterium minamisatsumaniensis TaxID=2910233 RepID=UPI003D0EFA82
MKPLYLALLVSSPIFANNLAYNQAHVQLLDRQVSVEVNTPNNAYYDETPIWKILEIKGWKAAQEAAKNQKISDTLNDEIHYQSTLNTLDQAVQKKQRASANALLTANTEWMNCQRIQWMWLDLQHEVSSGYGPKSKAKFNTILQNCPEFSLSTTQKLLGWTRPSAGTDILARYKRSTGFDSAEYNKLSYQVQLSQLSSQRASSPTAKAASKRVQQVQDPKGAELLGWQYLKAKNYEQAYSWFDQSIGWTSTPSQKQIEGKLLSLQGLNKTAEYNRFKSLWSARYPGLKKLNTSSDSPQLAKACETQPQLCLKLLQEQQNLTPEQHALAGWQWYKLDRPLTAKRSFEEALDGMPSDHKQFESTQYGYTLALNKAGFEQQAEYLAHKLSDPTQKSLYAKQRESKAILNAYEKQDYQYVIARSEQFESRFGKDIGLMEIKGWAYYNNKQNTQAVDTFQQLVDAYPHDEKYNDALKTAQCAQKKSYKLCL